MQVRFCHRLFTIVCTQKWNLVCRMQEHSSYVAHHDFISVFRRQNQTKLWSNNKIQNLIVVALINYIHFIWLGLDVLLSYAKNPRNLPIGNIVFHPLFSEIVKIALQLPWFPMGLCACSRADDCWMAWSSFLAEPWDIGYVYIWMVAAQWSYDGWLFWRCCNGLALKIQSNQHPNHQTSTQMRSVEKTRNCISCKDHTAPLEARLMERNRNLHGARRHGHSISYQVLISMQNPSTCHRSGFLGLTAILLQTVPMYHMISLYMDFVLRIAEPGSCHHFACPIGQTSLPQVLVMASARTGSVPARMMRCW